MLWRHRHLYQYLRRRPCRQPGCLGWRHLPILYIFSTTLPILQCQRATTTAATTTKTTTKTTTTTTTTTTRTTSTTTTTTTTTTTIGLFHQQRVYPQTNH